MITSVFIGRQKWQANLKQPLPIGILLVNDASLQPNAFYAPPYQEQPVVAGSFIGDTKQGGAVNFKTMQLTPHGNGTHTECVGHIAKEAYFLPGKLSAFHFVAQLISLTPEKLANGDEVITASQIPAIPEEVDALIIRTLPNNEQKTTQKWSGSNPPYVQPEAIEKIVAQGIEHFLLDLPSVDREEDGGALAAHKAFWQYPEATRTHATITEMIYVANGILDGYYLLNLQVPFIQTDACPSQPVLYKLHKQASGAEQKSE